MVKLRAYMSFKSKHINAFIYLKKNCRLDQKVKHNYKLCIKDQKQNDSKRLKIKIWAKLYKVTNYKSKTLGVLITISE
jgi:hypothetical protein